MKEILKKARNRLKKNSFFKLLVTSFRAIRNKNGFIKKTKSLFSFYKDLLTYKNTNPNFSFSWTDLYPRIFDKTTQTPLGIVYFYQDTWCAKKIFETKPSKHYDIGSMAEMVGIISQFTPTTMVDIRPLPIPLEGLSFVQGDILKLPFADKSVSSLSSICVIEHIGLGRYGDSFDPFGSEKAAKELGRILAEGGNLFISVPIDNENRIYFNAHRAFTRDYLLSLFPGLTLLEERYIYGDSFETKFDPKKGFGTGLYHFHRN